MLLLDLVISRGTCSDSIAKLFCASSYAVSRNCRSTCCQIRYRTNRPLSKLSTKGGVATYGGLPTSLTWHRSIAAIVWQYCEMGPLRRCSSKHPWCDMLDAQMPTLWYSAAAWDRCRPQRTLPWQAAWQGSEGLTSDYFLPCSPFFSWVTKETSMASVGQRSSSFKLVWASIWMGAQMGGLVLCLLIIQAPRTSSRPGRHPPFILARRAYKEHCWVDGQEKLELSASLCQTEAMAINRVFYAGDMLHLRKETVCATRVPTSVFTDSTVTLLRWALRLCKEERSERIFFSMTRDLLGWSLLQMHHQSWSPQRSFCLDHTEHATPKLTWVGFRTRDTCGLWIKLQLTARQL